MSFDFSNCLFHMRMHIFPQSFNAFDVSLVKNSLLCALLSSENCIFFQAVLESSLLQLSPQTTIEVKQKRGVYRFLKKMRDERNN